MSAIGAVGAASSIASVQARIGALEHRLGVRRALPTDAGSASVPAPSTTVGGVDVNGLVNDVLAGTSQLTSERSSFDDVFNAAVERLRTQREGDPTLASPVAATPVQPAQTSSQMSAQMSVQMSTSIGQAGLPGLSGSVSAATPYAALFEAAGARHGIPPKVLAAIGYVESRFQLDAVSSAGAIGMMQFLPSTAAGMGVDPHDPASAIDGAARYLRHAVDRFGSLDQAIAAYNVGPGSISRSGGVQPGTQAERYLQKVLDATGRV